MNPNSSSFKSNIYPIYFLLFISILNSVIHFIYSNHIVCSSQNNILLIKWQLELQVKNINSKLLQPSIYFTIHCDAILVFFIDDKVIHNDVLKISVKICNLIKFFWRISSHIFNWKNKTQKGLPPRMRK